MNLMDIVTLPRDHYKSFLIQTFKTSIEVDMQGHFSHTLNPMESMLEVPINQMTKVLQMK